MRALDEFYAILASGETVRALLHAPFDYSSTLDEQGYTFRVKSGPLKGRKATAATFDDAIRAAVMPEAS